jgi:hypothetical protein
MSSNFYSSGNSAKQVSSSGLGAGTSSSSVAPAKVAAGNFGGNTSLLRREEKQTYVNHGR